MCLAISQKPPGPHTLIGVSSQWGNMPVPHFLFFSFFFWIYMPAIESNANIIQPN